MNYTAQAMVAWFEFLLRGADLTDFKASLGSAQAQSDGVDFYDVK